MTSFNDGLGQTVTSGKDGVDQRIIVANEEVDQSKKSKNEVHEYINSSKGRCIARLEFVRTDCTKKYLLLKTQQVIQ